ncbi:hypothetical protein HP546_29325 [Pseudomonas sp. CM25]|uniref:hypothetical protein n=1 Tax=Pseudomonas sp. CM25 TaxID=2738448 RepID=UPI0015516650|nr:hypothetical protein [Pseudomonas sp. CM25]NQD59439.1 hypothetical protein [Pseudomonas sp. CM25]
MNFATALTMPATPPADTPAQRKADRTHAQMLRLATALCRCHLLPASNTVH